MNAKTPQNILIDLEIATDVRAAAVSDDLQHTIDYAAVRRHIIEYVEGVQFQLIETLADRLAERLMQTFSVSCLRLTMTKKPFDIPDAEGVGVVIERVADST